MKKILVIEDDAPIGWLLERMLRGKHYVILMNNAADALIWLSDGNTCDVIIADLSLSAEGCTGLLEKLRLDMLLRNIPVMVLSTDEELRGECLQLGAFAFVLKPLELQRLLPEVKARIEELTESVLIASVKK
jgi:two-component system, chemotaxis family, chemotaxis protein CheY